MIARMDQTSDLDISEPIIDHPTSKETSIAQNASWVPLGGNFQDRCFIKPVFSGAREHTLLVSLERNTLYQRYEVA